MKDKKLTMSDIAKMARTGKSGYGRDQRYIEVNSIQEMTIFSDTSSIEIFINHGQYTLTSRVYDDVKVVQLSSHRKLKGTYYLLNSFKIND